MVNILEFFGNAEIPYLTLYLKLPYNQYSFMFSDRYMQFILFSVNNKFIKKIIGASKITMSTRKKVIIKSEVTSNQNCSLLHLFNDIDNIDDIRLIRNKLLSWFHANKRELPWRTIASRRNDIEDDIRGYSVWVSEIMLQQTQVSTVIGIDFIKYKK